jgi:hypothetical protein
VFEADLPCPGGSAFKKTAAVFSGLFFDSHLPGPA